MIGRIIKSNYRIIDEIGRGSVATVYLAKDTTNNTVVALKIIHPERVAEGQFLQRFRREAKLLTMLSSPHGVKILDYGEDRGLDFIVLEYVQGKTLADILQEEGSLPVSRALDIAKQVALCLVDAHAKDIVHRDLRPANIMITPEGIAKVMDYGIAQGAGLSKLTATGVLGSPHYLSPEQASMWSVDGRSDIYSLGVMLFEMLCGHKPYTADTAADTILAHLHAPIPSLCELGDIPQEVDALVGKCLAKKPQDRYQSAAEFLEAIDTTLRTLAKKKANANIDLEADLIGQTLGAYRIVEQIGRGGMATVYKAYEPALDRYVAIKVLPRYFAHDPEFALRFEREAKAVARLNHQNILPIYSYGQEAGLSYIVMRYVEAGTLGEMLGQPLDLGTTVDLLGQIGRALEYAHQQEIVHRDVKPSNVLMASGEWALLADFGLARMVESSVQITKSGVGVGTPAYMSPEQGQGLPVDARSDVYSMGVMLYEMVTGKVPYEAETPMAVVLKHITAPLVPPRRVNPDLPEAVERVVLKAMAKEPDDRYQTAAEMVEALERAAVLEKPTEPSPGAHALPPVRAAEPIPPREAREPIQPPPKKKKGLPIWVWGAFGAGVLLIVVVASIVAGGLWFASRNLRSTPTLGATIAVNATSTPLPQLTATPTATAEEASTSAPATPPTATATREPSPTPAEKATSTAIPQSTVTPSQTPTHTPTGTPTHTPTLAPTSTPTHVPSPTPRWLPAPTLIAPANNASFAGWNAEVMLQWSAVQQMAQDEYYVIRIPYDSAGGVAEFWRSEKSFRVPQNYSLKEVGFPDRHYNWSVQVMRCTEHCDKIVDDGVRKAGVAVGDKSEERTFFWHPDVGGGGSSDGTPAAPTPTSPPAE